MSFSFAHPALRRALSARNYAEPTPVQKAVMTEETEGRDLLVSAQTGSGKTVAFGLALAKPLLGDADRFTAPGAPRALIVCPTRELALQVHRELYWLYAETGARITTCVGGMDPRREQHALANGVHVVVGTPGRLCDHLERGALSLARIEAVVLDEADEMLDMGFREDLERLLDAAPPTRRTLMFSATIPKEIATLAKRYQKNALRIATTSEAERHHDIEYHAVPIIPRERDLAVVNLLRYHDATGALVFCATRDGVTHTAAILAERGFSVAALSGELSQRERNTALQALRDGRARVCVATDVAARGLDLPDLGLVIHADLPQNKQVLVHRSGRTGRAGKKGLAVLLVPDPARRYVERILHSAHIVAQWKLPPSAEAIRLRDQDQLVLEIRQIAEDLGEDDRQVARTLLADRPAEDLVAALVRERRTARPSPEELTTPPSMRPRTQNDRPPIRTNDRPPIRSQPARERPERSERPERTERQPERTERAERPERTERRVATVPVEVERRTTKPKGQATVSRAEAMARRTSGGGEHVWFSINIGRSKNADPKWLIPLLCRRGNITKTSIGKIQILAKETRVQIATDVAAQFAAAAREPDAKDRNIHIDPVDE